MVERCEFIRATLHRIFGAPAPSSAPRRHGTGADTGITAFLKTYCFPRRLASVRGASGPAEVDPKALGTLIHDQLALWAPSTRSAPVDPAESARVRASLLPQTRALIEHFERRRFILLTANLVVRDPRLRYDTPIDLLALDVTHLQSSLVRLLLVEIKTTRRAAATGPAGTRCIAQIAPHLPYETPEAYAITQATLPAIRMNEVLDAHQSVFRERGFSVHVLPYVVFLRMGDRGALTVQEYVAPLAMQTVSFRDSLVPLLEAPPPTVPEPATGRGRPKPAIVKSRWK